jgi:hypothetical protein
VAKPDSKTTETTTVAEPESTAVGKGRPTPTRREREAANQRPLVASGKEAQKAQRARLAEQRDRARVGLANGEERFLPDRDKGPQRRFIRDHVDARFIAMTLVQSAAVQSITLLVLWGFFALAVVDCLIVGRSVNRKLAAKYGAENVRKGNRWYAAMRAMQLKPMRLPKPQVKRGEYPTA